MTQKNLNRRSFLIKTLFFSMLLLNAFGCGSGELKSTITSAEDTAVSGSGDQPPLPDEDTNEQDTEDTNEQDTQNDTTSTDVSPEEIDDAQIQSVSLPSNMNCGESIQASVTVQNIGNTTWTREDGFKLGAVDDSDPFYSNDTRIWLPADAIVFPGDEWSFEFELQAPSTEGIYVTDWQMVHEGVRWFGEITTAEVSVTCGVQVVCDPLTNSALEPDFNGKIVDGGSFSSAGWQSTDTDDQIMLELSVPISGDAIFEIDVTNFDPPAQYSNTKHQILNMYTSDNGSQDVFETDEAWWNIRTGTNYGTGMKLLAAPNGGDSREEVRLIENATWNPSASYRFKMEWDSLDIHIYLNDDHLYTLPFDGRVQPLQYIFVGKDNVFYDGQAGPIYSNLCITYNP